MDFWSFYVFTYHAIDMNWKPSMNPEVSMDIAQFIYPIDSATIMKVLKRNYQISRYSHGSERKDP